MAFVTSAGTLDKRDESVRQMLADKADFIGAIRLPGGKNGAFKDNAGTEVTTDIIFLKNMKANLLPKCPIFPIGYTLGRLRTDCRSTNTLNSTPIWCWYSC